MEKVCPCGNPLKVITVMNLSLHVEAELVTCLCGRVREYHEPDKNHEDFIRFTHKLMGKEVGRGQCKLNETSTDKFKMLADSL